MVLSVRRHHARVTHQIMLLVLSSAGARGAKGSNESRLQLTTFFSLVLGSSSLLPHCLAYFASLVRPVSVIYICILVFLTVFFQFHRQSFLYANFVNLFSFSFLYAFLSIEISLHNFFVTYIVKFGCTSGKSSHSACLYSLAHFFLYLSFFFNTSL